MVADHGPPLDPGRCPRGGLPWRILLSDPGYAGQYAVKGLPRWVRARSFARPTRGSAHLRVRVPAHMHEGGGPRVASPTTDRGSGSRRLPQVRHTSLNTFTVELLNTLTVELLNTLTVELLNTFAVESPSSTGRALPSRVLPPLSRDGPVRTVISYNRLY